jgi:hypothetical protein
MSKVVLPPSSPYQNIVLELRAAKSFTEGELGIVRTVGVVAVDLSRGVEPRCFLVRALTSVRRGQFGTFVEIRS